MYYSDGLIVKKSKTGGLDDIYYRGPDQGGGVAGINYAEKSDGTGLNYKFYNLRGDVVRTENSLKRRISQSSYDAFGEHTDLGSITTDTFTANTKEENFLGLLNEGKRWRSLKYGVFLTPDPLEYKDGLNPYIYCGQNPWGRWDPLGLESWNSALYKNPKLAGDLSKAAASNLNFTKAAKNTATLVNIYANALGDSFNIGSEVGLSANFKIKAGDDFKIVASVGYALEGTINIKSGDAIGGAKASAEISAAFSNTVKLGGEYSNFSGVLFEGDTGYGHIIDAEDKFEGHIKFLDFQKIYSAKKSEEKAPILTRKQQEIAEGKKNAQINNDYGIKIGAGVSFSAGFDSRRFKESKNSQIREINKKIEDSE